MEARVMGEDQQSSEHYKIRGNIFQVMNQPLLQCMHCKQILKSQSRKLRHNYDRGNFCSIEERAKAAVKCVRTSFTRQSDMKRDKCQS